MSKVKKVVLRKKFLEIRKKINREKELTSSLNEKVLNFFTKSKNNIIAGYISVNNEIDIFNSLKRIVINNLVCLPEIVEGNRKLNFNKWDLCSEMIIGSYKIPIPKKKELVIPNYVIVPLVAFDKKKNRLGYGGGYYDVTINYHKELNRDFKTIGVGFDQQECSSIPHEKFDEPLDMIITPSKIIS